MRSRTAGRDRFLAGAVIVAAAFAALPHLGAREERPIASPAAGGLNPAAQRQEMIVLLRSIDARLKQLVEARD